MARKRKLSTVVSSDDEQQSEQFIISTFEDHHPSSSKAKYPVGIQGTKDKARTCDKKSRKRGPRKSNAKVQTIVSSNDEQLSEQATISTFEDHHPSSSKATDPAEMQDKAGAGDKQSQKRGPRKSNAKDQTGDVQECKKKSVSLKVEDTQDTIKETKETLPLTASEVGSSSHAPNHLEESPNRSYVLIDQLQAYDRDWVVKVRVLRRGNLEPYCTSKGSGQTWKIIFMDEKGTKIQAIVFNDVADILQQSLQKDKTYLISTGLIKPVNPQFDSAHNRFELTFSSSTQVKELETNIDIAQLRLQFVSFNDLKHRVEDNGIIDVVGLLGDIDNLSLLKKPGGGGIMKRDMILTNTEFDTVVITLWADLAKNEGNILSELADDKPIVVLSKAKVTRYGGLVSLSTRSTTTLHINPALPEVEALKLCHNTNHESATPLRGLKLQNAERVNIEELIERPLNEFQKNYCSFKGTIVSIDNMEKPWYDACNECSKKVVFTEQGAKCHGYRCCGTNKIGKFSPRYMLKLTVGNGIRNVYVTLFEAAERIINCPVYDFINLKEKEGVNSKYYKDLIQQYGLSYIFLVKIDKKSDRIGQRLIAEEVHKDADGVSLEGTKGVIDLENMTTDLQDEKTSFKNQKFKAIKVEKE